MTKETMRISEKLVVSKISQNVNEYKIYAYNIYI